MNEIQVKFMQSLGLNLDMPYDVIEDKVSDYLERNGFDEDYNITEVGKVCESILDYIGTIGD